MKKKISSDMLIGNFIIEILKRGCINLSVDELFRFAKLVQGELASSSYFTYLEEKNVQEFFEDFYYFVEDIDKEDIITLNKDINLRTVMKRFREVTPSLVIKAMEESYNIVEKERKTA